MDSVKKYVCVAVIPKDAVAVAVVVRDFNKVPLTELVTTNVSVTESLWDSPAVGEALGSVTVRRPVVVTEMDGEADAGDRPLDHVSE